MNEVDAVSVVVVSDIAVVVATVEMVDKKVMVGTKVVVGVSVVDPLSVVVNSDNIAVVVAEFVVVEAMEV